MISNAGLFTVVKHCTSLRHLTVDKKQFSEEIIHHLEQKDIRLHHANIECLNNINDFTTRIVSKARSVDDESSNSQPSIYDGVMFGMVDLHE